MTPLAASILGYVLGLVTALIAGAFWALVRGGQEARRADRLSSTKKGRGW